MNDIFISYASEDRAKAETLARALEQQGWSVWWDRTIPAGRTFDEVIEEAIDEARCIIVLWSKVAVASRWVRTEAEEGARRNILLPVLIEKVRIPLAFRRIQAADLIDWDGDTSDVAFDKLIADISGILGPSPFAEEQRLQAERNAEEERLKKEEEQRVGARRQEEKAKRDAEKKRQESEAKARPEEEREKRQKADAEAKRKAEEEEARGREKVAQEAREQARQEELEEHVQAKTAGVVDQPSESASAPESTRRAPWIPVITIAVIVLVVGAVFWNSQQLRDGHDEAERIAQEQDAAKRREAERLAQEREDAKHRQIGELLERSQQAEAANRLTTPAQDNAADHYREILSLDPENAAAREGLKRIVTRYIEWAEHGLGQRDWDDVEKNLARAESVDPDDPAIRQLSAELEKAREPPIARPPQDREFSDRLKNGDEGPEMVVISAGMFQMGDIQGDGGANEKPVHEVRIRKPFAIGRYEVTFEEYDRFVEATGREPPGDEGLGRGRHPVINASWGDAVAYAEWLSEQTGKRYRLPSEAEWEYSTRAGTETPWSFGDSEKVLGEYAWYGGNSDGQTREVGTREPNPWGLHDMHGNVWEWVQDCWHENYRRAPDDASAWLEADGGDCARRVIRGGSWDDEPGTLRSAYRNGRNPDDRSGTLGFRLAQDIE